MFTAILSLLNVTIMGFALFKRTTIAAWGSILTQIPWCIWDVKTHNEWFFLIAGGTVAVCGTSLWRQRVRLSVLSKREIALVFSAL